MGKIYLRKIQPPYGTVVWSHPKPSPTRNKNEKILMNFFIKTKKELLHGYRYMGRETDREVAVGFELVVACDGIGGLEPVNWDVFHRNSFISVLLLL